MLIRSELRLWTSRCCSCIMSYFTHLALEMFVSCLIRIKVGFTINIIILNLIGGTTSLSASTVINVRNQIIIICLVNLITVARFLVTSYIFLHQTFVKSLSAVNNFVLVNFGLLRNDLHLPNIRHYIIC